MTDNSITHVGSALISGMNAHNLDLWAKYLAPNFVGEYPGARGINQDVARQFNQSFLDAFPDLHFDVHEVVANSSMVAIRWTGGGTFEAPLRTATGQTIPPNGKRGAIDGVFIVTVENGKIVKERSYWSELELMGQLGMMQPA
jgi:predicted ester cyclase